VSSAHWQCLSLRKLEDLCPRRPLKWCFSILPTPGFPARPPASYRRKDLGLGNYKGAEAVREAVGG
jgi:hypothetical protein